MDLGKSTLGKLIAGLEKPSKGLVQIDELKTADKKNFLEIRKKVGVVFQNPENQILFSNVKDDIEFALRNLNLSNSEDRIENALKKVDMSKFINSDAYELSLGQKQRLTIAEAIAINSKYIVLDEPTAMIDPLGKEAIYKIIKELKKQGYTIIYITNIIDEILMSDKILLLEDGRIVKTFMKQEILNNIEELKKYKIKIPERYVF